MTGTKLYQCIPAYKPKVTVRLIKFLLGIGCSVLLDIEDSIQDVQHPELTIIQKAKARQDFVEIIQSILPSKISLRVNAVKSNEFHKDKFLLNQFAESIESVFIPKVESSADIDAFYLSVSSKHKLNLIIETQRGIDNLDEILSSKFSDRFEHIFFGNYDYHLDTNVYPVTEQHSLKYWKMIEPVISKIENRQFNFGNSPYANIGDTGSLNFSLMQLRKLCNKNFALMSLHKTQTVYLQSLMEGWNLSLNTLNTNLTCHFTLDSFINKKQKGRSFAFYNKRIITPQEYLLLQRSQNE